MARYSKWPKSEKSVSTALLRSQWHYDLTEWNPSNLFILHCYDHNGTMNSLSKHRGVCFYCIVTITMPRWSLWLNSEQSVLNCIVTITMALWFYWVNSDHFDLLHCYNHNGTMTSMSKLRIFWFYCIVTTTMARWTHWQKSVHSVCTTLLRSQWHDDLN
jgi:hypothetical protein